MNKALIYYLYDLYNSDVENQLNIQSKILGPIFKTYDVKWQTCLFSFLGENSQNFLRQICRILVTFVTVTKQQSIENR
jgi:hypothetical protein